MKSQKVLQPQTADELCAELLFILWVAFPLELKERYKSEAWSIFQSRVRAAALQNGTLQRAVSHLAQRLGMPIGRSASAAKRAVDIIKGPLSDEILRLMRDETAYVIALVMQLNAERKEAFEYEYSA